MKIVTANEMMRIEHAAYKRGFKEATFMAAAGRGIALSIKEFIERKQLEKVVSFLCAKGNNSGDGYVAANLLHHAGFRTIVYQLTPIEEATQLCKEHHDHYVKEGGYVTKVYNSSNCSSFAKEGVIVDALFGTGFRGQIRDHYAVVIEEANRSGLPILSIDIPSGLQGSTGRVEGAAICASQTIYLGLPKLGFFIEQGWNHVGSLKRVAFGLDEHSLKDATSEAILLNRLLVKDLLPHVMPNRHKYEAGVVAVLAGSSEMPGAAILACRAAMRTGAGLVRLIHRQGEELGNLPEEVVRVPYRNAEEVVAALNGADAALVGPGLGRKGEIGSLLHEVVENVKVPVVLDADALYWCACQGLPYPKYSKETVITPHFGEMKRLLHSDATSVSHEFLKAVQEYSHKKKVCVLLKGGPSFIFFPEELPLVSIEGDPGMATAGSGDVLAGVVVTLMAQGLHNRDATALAAYLHGVAGKTAAQKIGSRSMIASDIVRFLPEAFRVVEGDS